MSGRERIERAILARVDKGDAVALKDLASWIYHRHQPVTNTQQQSVRRAAHSLARKYPEKIVLPEDENGDLL
jgi:hypothetical protein